MWEKLKKIISCVIAAAVTVSMLGYMTDLLERKDSDLKYQDFFDQDEEFDVLFMGTSHVINAVYPMELWKDYGIVSYNFGGHSNQFATTYWVMENALDYTKPKLMVIDCLTLSGAWKCSDIFSYMHLSLDAFPLSVTKVRAVWDLLDDPVLQEAIDNGKARESDEPRTKIGLLWDYSAYHSRWNEVKESDFNPVPQKEKGAESRINLVQAGFNKIPREKKIEGGTVGEEYLFRMIEDCQKRNIEVLLTYLPFPAGEGQQMEANRVYDIAEKYGVDYINFLDLDIVNYGVDCFDANSHLNPSGARKVTKYLGQYITEHYGIEDKRSNADYEFWNTDYSEYEAMKDSNIKAQSSIVNYPMLLSGDKVNVIIEVRNKDIFKNQLMLNLFRNMGVNTDELGDNTDIILIKNGGEKAWVFNDFKASGGSADTELGRIYISGERNGYYDIMLNERKIFEGNSSENNCMKIAVYRSGELIDNVKFVYSVNPETTIVNVASVER